MIVFGLLDFDFKQGHRGWKTDIVRDDCVSDAKVYSWGAEPLCLAFDFFLRMTMEMNEFKLPW